MKGTALSVRDVTPYDRACLLGLGVGLRPDTVTDRAGGGPARRPGKRRRRHADDPRRGDDAIHAERTGRHILAHRCARRLLYAAGRGVRVRAVDAGDCPHRVRRPCHCQPPDRRLRRNRRGGRTEARRRAPAGARTDRRQGPDHHERSNRERRVLRRRAGVAGTGSRSVPGPESGRLRLRHRIAPGVTDQRDSLAARRRAHQQSPLQRDDPARHDPGTHDRTDRSARRRTGSLLRHARRRRGDQRRDQGVHRRRERSPAEWLRHEQGRARQPVRARHAEWTSVRGLWLQGQGDRLPTVARGRDSSRAPRISGAATTC